MFDFLQTIVTPTVPISDIVLRLVGALALGWLVALVYRLTRADHKASKSMQATLVLLSILIAIVVLVVGESPARAFSLVGALSIVRFRTVVQDTQDTAFVIFAVVMGMAAGTHALWTAVIGMVVVSGAAFLMRTRELPSAPAIGGFRLNLRVGLGHDVEALLPAPMKLHASKYRLASMETARQGTAIEATYDVQFRPDGSAEGLVKALNRLEGVQSVELQDAGLDDDDD